MAAATVRHFALLPLVVSPHRGGLEPPIIRDETRVRNVAKLQNYADQIGKIEKRTMLKISLLFLGVRHRITTRPSRCDVQLLRHSTALS